MCLFILPVKENELHHFCSSASPPKRLNPNKEVKKSLVSSFISTFFFRLQLQGRAGTVDGKQAGSWRGEAGVKGGVRGWREKIGGRAASRGTVSRGQSPRQTPSAAPVQASLCRKSLSPINRQTIPGHVARLPRSFSFFLH